MEEDRHCKANFFQCKNDHFCVSMRYVCDGIFDCYDKTDEENCQNDMVDKFLCDDDTRSIHYTLVCDGIPDCQDKTDEIPCGFIFHWNIFFNME